MIRKLFGNLRSFYMRLIFFIFLISQLLNSLGVFAEKAKENMSELNHINWEKLEGNKSNALKKVIWKYYDNDENYFENKNLENNSDSKIFKNQKEKLENFFESNNMQGVLHIQPHIPSNNYLDYGKINFSTEWKSAFDGGAAGGTGNQNIALKFDYGLSNESLLSIYLSETDDPLYKLINGKVIPNNWASIATEYKKKIFESKNLNNSLSLSSSLEYWVVSSGDGNIKSIYDEVDNAAGLDRNELFIYSLSLPYSKKLFKNSEISIVPGATFVPDTIGNKYIGSNFYGTNYYLGTGLSFDFLKNTQFIGSYTYLFGPGNNSFDENLKFSRRSIYSYGLNWNVSPIIGIEGKITNGYGSTPATSLLTIPSDDKPLYYLGGTYKPFMEDVEFVPLEEKNKSLLFGGITVDNALFPENGESVISLNYDSKGNLFGFYGYSLSNIFQIELLNIGGFNQVTLPGNNNSVLYKNYLGENNFNFRLGGKLLIFSPQKEDLYWLSLRTSVGRNNHTNQGYSFSELINTFRINNRIVFNVSPRYFFSGSESFGGIGFSSYINLLDNLQFIPEINTSFNNNSDFNSTFALRYSYLPKKSIDLYYSNAAGIQDVGQLLKDQEYRLGIKLNFIL